MAKVLLIAQWTDGQGRQYEAGEVVAVDETTAATLRDTGICDPAWVGPTGGDRTDWVGPTSTP